MQSCILAVDIGASSGRHIVGTVQKGKLVLREVYRFENGVHRQNGHLCWDIEALAREVLNGLKAAHDAGYTPATVGIDTWAVDFVLLDKNGKRLLPKRLQTMQGYFCMMLFSLTFLHGNAIVPSLMPAVGAAAGCGIYLFVALLKHEVF